MFYIVKSYVVRNEMKCMNNLLIWTFLLLVLDTSIKSDDMGDMGDSINWVI